MQVGDKIFILAHKGERIGESPIVGETRMSWLISDFDIKPEDVTPKHWSITKVSKKDLASGTLYGYKATRQEAEDVLWVQDNYWKLASFVQGIREASILRQIADLVGYVSKTS